MLARRPHQGANHALGRNSRLAGALRLGVEKGNIKARVVRHERRIADDRNSSATAPNNGLSAKNSAVSPCTSIASAGALRAHVAMKRLAG
jgi:hypothetical protein